MTEIISLVTKPLPICYPDSVSDLIAGLARTEDCRLSPDGARLAIAGFARNRIALFDLAPPQHGTGLQIVSATAIICPLLAYPHGLDFLVPSRLAVANRKGDVIVLDLPETREGISEVGLTPSVVFDRVKVPWKPFQRKSRGRLLSPGSVAVQQVNGTSVLWVLENRIDRITRHTLPDDPATGGTPAPGEVAITDDLALPDGIAISADGLRLAISNHNTFEVLLFALDDTTRPTLIGRATGLDFPHGLRFADDDRALLVADAGQPFVTLYRTQTGWSCDHSPSRKLRIMDDETYCAGRTNIQEGGPKGIEIDPRRGLMIVTSEHQPLAVFALSDVLGNR